MKPLRVISIFGPTASGKTKCAIEIAQALDGVILNFDSLQWYKGLPILSAKPSDQELQQAPHFLYDYRSFHHKGSVMNWLENVEACVSQNNLADRWIIMVGGTGFWLNCFLDGLSEIPLIQNEIALKVDDLFHALDFQEFKEYVFKMDPTLLDRNPPQDPQRLKRALAVKMQTGRSIRELQGKRTQKFNFQKIIPCVLNPEKEILEQRIAQRFEAMLTENVILDVEEFESIVPNPNCPTKCALGYWAILDYLNQKISYEEMKERVIIETRQYAKRQRTWLKNKFPNAFDLRQNLEQVIHLAQER